MTCYTLGEKVWQLRKDRKWTQGRCAKEAGLTVPYICDIEHDRINPSIKSIQKLANGFGITVVNMLSDVKGMF